MSTRSPSRVLVIAAHPDDDVLGCGGTVALHARAGDEVHTAIACEGESLRYGRAGVGQPEHICRAARTLGVRDVRMLGFPDQRLDTLTLTYIIGSLTSLVREIHPDIVYCQHGGDVNRDHELLFKAALVATRPTAHCLGAVYAFDTASSTEWAYPHPRSLDALRNRAKAWGNQTCNEAAEVFLTVRRTRRNGETPA